MSTELTQKSAVLPGLRLAVLITCFNRVSSTTQCIQALKDQSSLAADLNVFLVDDGSSDGTASAVLEIMPATKILTGDGNLFWCGGMHRAFSEAKKGHYDFYLWLNDDTYLYPDALTRLIKVATEASSEHGGALIVVGSVEEPIIGGLTYGGWRFKRGRFGLNSWEKIPPDLDRPIQCDTMNGNCVLISKEVVHRVGNIDTVFTQAMGDLDYGLRARKNGCGILIAPGYYGTCRINDSVDSWSDKSLTIYKRWKKLLGPKGFPIRSWGAFAYRHKGPLWFFAWMAPYWKFWVDAMTSRLPDRK